jgi:quinoprotein glucose dehydrogenase
MRFSYGLFLLLMLPIWAQPHTEPINPANVARLKVAWTYDTGDSTEPVRPGGNRPKFEATPVYAAPEAGWLNRSRQPGRLYLSTPAGSVIALDAEKGQQSWKIDLHIQRNANYGDFVSRGLALRGEKLYVATVDARLVCLDRDSGQFCSGFGSGGQVDLSAGLRRKPRWAGEYGVTSPPAIYRDLVIVGSTVADNSRLNMASGEVRAFDAATGALRWTFHPLPEDSPAGAANTWSRIVVDDQNGLVFLPTGSASPDYFGGLRPGDNRYANSIVALKAGTGEIVWHFQTVHHDLWDYDVASPPLLYPSKKGRAVAVGSKTGHLFLFRRLTGEPLFPVSERPVPTSGVPGEQGSPTQPFPSRPPGLVPQLIREQDLWGPTPGDLEACRATFRSLRNEGIFTPPSLQGSLGVPGNIGGLHWGGAVFDPVRRLLIAPVNRLPAVVRLIPREQFDKEKKAHPERETTEQDGTPYSMSRQFFMSPSGAPCIAPPWGELVAVQADTGNVAWRVPLGDLRNVITGSGESPTGSPNLGGPIATTTGLVFIGATLDGYFRAFETRQGREVWKAKLPTSARATPLLFTAASGRQMIVIAAGGHDSPLSRLDTKLVAFALGDK